MSQADKEDASEGVVGLLSMDMLIIIGIRVFIAGHET
jgi:hypothetical protein